MSRYSEVILATSGIAGYWKLDETGGTTATDDQGSIDLTYAGDFTLDQTAVADGKSVLFGNSGGNEGKASSATVPTAATNTVTLQAWIVCNDVTVSEQVILSNGNDDTNGYALVISGNATTNGRLYALRGGVAWHDTGFQMVTGKTYHVALAIDGSNVARVYVNAVQVASISSFNPNAPSGLFTISGGNAGTRYFKGRIDEVAVYTAALSQATLLSHHEAAFPLAIYPQLFVRRPTWPFRLNTLSLQSRGLVLWWPGYPYTTGGIRDLSLRGVNDTARTAESTQPMATDPQMGFVFNQDGSQHWGNGDMNGLNGTTSPHSVACWCYLTDSDNGCLFGWGSTVTDSGIGIFANGGATPSVGAFDATGGGIGTYLQASLPSTVALPGWFHLCYTHDGTTNRIYFNGVELANSTAAVTAVTPGTVYIGRSVHDGFTFFTPSSVRSCDLRYYNEAVAPGVVRQMVDPKTRWELYLVPSKRRVWAQIASAFSRSLSESLALAETYARRADANRLCTDNIGLQEVFARVSHADRNYADQIGFPVEAFVRIAVAHRLAQDSLGLQEGFARIASGARVYAEALALAEELEILHLLSASHALRAQDYLAFDDAAARVADASRAVNDFLAMADALTRTVAFSRAVEDYLALLEAVTVEGPRNVALCDRERKRADEGCDIRLRKVR